MVAGRKGRALGIFRMNTSECPGCADEVSRSLLLLNGVSDVEINFVTDNVHVRYDPGSVTSEQIRRAIGLASGVAHPVTRGTALYRSTPEQRQRSSASRVGAS